MKVNKTQGVLFIFDKLLNNGFVTRNMILQELEISNLTFYRYIQEIKAYLYNFVSNKELDFDKASQRYILKKVEF